MKKKIKVILVIFILSVATNLSTEIFQKANAEVEAGARPGWLRVLPSVDCMFNPNSRCTKW